MKKDKSKIWAIIEQAVFGIFIIVALYAIGYSARNAGWQGLTPSKLRNNYSLGGTSSVNINQIYGLSISAIVIAFVGIVMPFISLLFSNRKLNFAIGWVMIVIDTVVLALMIAAISMWIHDLTVYGEAEYGKGFATGQFILTFVGAGIAFAGIGVSYKHNLSSWS